MAFFCLGECMPDQELMRGEFNFFIPLAKAVEENGKLYVEGVASDTLLDLQKQRISLQGQHSMVYWAKQGTVVLGGEADHFKLAFDDDLGFLVDGQVTKAGEFFIRAELDPDNPRALGLYRALKKGKKLGLSVFGKVTRFHVEKDTPVIDEVTLTRVMVTPSPANPRTWVDYVGKALTYLLEEVEMGKEMEEGQAPEVEAPELVVAAAPEAAAPEPEVEIRAAVEPEAELAAEAGGAVASGDEVALAETPEEAEEDIFAAAKGAFQEALQRIEERRAKMQPVTDQVARVQAFAALTDVLWDVVEQAYYAGTEPAQAAEVMAQAIDEYKAEVAAKTQPEAETTEAEPQGTEEPEAPQEVHKAEAEEPTFRGVLAAMETQSPEAGAAGPSPAVTVARSFAEAIEHLMALDLEPTEQRQAVGEALAAAAETMDKALPAGEQEEMPSWARALFVKIEALEKGLAGSSNVGAGRTDGTPPEATDSPVLPERKSHNFSVRPSAIVEKQTQFRDIISTWFGGDAPQVNP